MELKLPGQVREEVLGFVDEAKDKEDVTDSLERLEELAIEFQELEGELALLEQKLKDKKKEFLSVSQDKIPMLLRQYGLSEIKLRSGKKVIVSENVSVSVPEEKEEAFREFLKAQNAEDLVKLQFFFSRMPVAMQKKLFDFLNEQEYEYSSKSDVHPETLKKFFKELFGLGEDDREEGVKEGRYKNPTDVDVAGAVNVYTFFSTKIKEKKK